MNKDYRGVLGRLAVLSGLICVGWGCLIENDCPDKEEWQQAVVVYTGAPEVDGCGWMISIKDSLYHPVNLDESFKINDLAIRIQYIPDPEVFRCGRGGVIYPSIRITGIESDSPAVGILKEDQWDKLPMDMFRMDSAYIAGDLVFLRVGYSGGCREHQFGLWKLPPQPIDNPPVELMLSHNANGDMCEAYLTEWLSFSLISIRARGKQEVTFLLRGSPEMSAYFGQFTYKY